MRFYLGTHMPSWLGRLDVPLFVSHRRLRDRKTLPVARHGWALDSGGFTELSMYGEWRTPSADYIAAARRYRDEIGQLDWCAPQDWMCEPWIVERTGLSVAEHQARTVDNFLLLSSEAPDVPWVPVLQGWSLADYQSHVAAYERAGVDLAAHHTVGLGSVCRRQALSEIAEIVASISALGLRLHGFGVKGGGIARYGWMLASADSMAWSARGRRIFPCPHTGAKTCANCMTHALEWRRSAMRSCDLPVQMALGAFQ